jgi:hypothetical protein
MIHRGPRLLAVALALALTTIGAQAQSIGGGPGGGRHKHAKTDKTATAKPVVDEKAYKDALKNLPDKKFDAWHNMR